MPRHLGKLVKVFDTPEDLTLSLKGSSTEIGAKVTMALAKPHGENVDWDKVSSSLAIDSCRKTVSIKVFLEEAKTYSPKITTLILPAGAPLARAAPSSSATPTTTTTPTEVS
jgi:hypothetical protein